MEEKNYKPIKINFTEEEYQTLKHHAEQCNLTMVELCRMLLNGYHPKPTPDEAYRVSVEQLYRLHSRLNPGSVVAMQLQDIILNFQKLAYLPERSGSIGNNKPVAHKRTD